MEQVQSQFPPAPVFLIAGCNRNASEETDPDIQDRKEHFGL